MMGKTENVTKTPYAEWLEGMIRAIMQHQPDRVGVCMLLPNGQVCTGYYGECFHQDKALMAHNIYLDAVGVLWGRRKKRRIRMTKKGKKADIYRAELQSGMSCREIAERHGVSLQAVYAACGSVRNNAFRPYGEMDCTWEGLRNWLNEQRISRRNLLQQIGLEYGQDNLRRLNQNLKGEKDLRMSFIRKMMDISDKTFEELFCGDNADGKERL